MTLTNNRKPLSEKSPQYIFLDNNVIQYSADKNKSKSHAFVNLFDSLRKEGFELAISEITLFENLYAFYGKRQKKAYTYLSRFIKKVVSEEVLLFAAKLAGLYKEETNQDIKISDTIIAATAILEKGFILTRDHKDFPPPFFDSVRWLPVSFLISGKYKNTIDVCLYKARYQLISRRIKEKDKASS